MTQCTGCSGTCCTGTGNDPCTCEETITLEAYTVLKCEECGKYIDQSRIVYAKATADHYEEHHPAIHAAAIEANDLGVPYAFWNEDEVTIPTKDLL